ncbi:hypothetical protein CW702_02365 [Candidatus Bathyarchaeota archaeon]|nr:MAG: hypothetical protein CW702_02365 [Candidatus Bathyarchaeota archaeon]
MAEKEEKNLRDWLSIILPRVLKAAFWGFIMGGELLIPLFLPGLGEQIEGLFPRSQMRFTHLVAIFVAMEVAIQLFDGTIIRYAISMARTIISMISLYLVTNGGIMTIKVSGMPGTPLPTGQTITFTIDFSPILGILLIFSILSIVKNLLQAIDFLSQKAEEPVDIPELP